MKNRCTTTSKNIVLMLVCVLLALHPVLVVSAQSSTVVRAEASTSQPHVGQTLTVEVTISNVQNLFGIDLTLNWNTSVLQVVSATSLLGVESHPGGVLHETSNYPIYVVEDNASQAAGEYVLVATSTGQTTQAFSGSGTIATLKFNVISPGPAGLALQTDLSDYNPNGSNFIAHTDTGDLVTAVAPGSSSTPSSTPEFPSTTILALFIALATAAIILTAKQLNKNKVASIKKKVTLTIH